MTDIVAQAKNLYRQIEWQTVPQDIGQEEMTEMIVDGIRDLYVMTGRSSNYSASKLTEDCGLYITFADDLALDEEAYVLVTAQIFFYSKVQSDVSELTSYSTDAMTVSHGDKPFANLQQKIEDLKQKQRQIWYKMTRYHFV